MSWMDMANFFRANLVPIKVAGKMDKKQDSERKYGKMALFTKVSISKTRDMGKESTLSQQAKPTAVSGITTRSKAM